MEPNLQSWSQAVDERLARSALEDKFSGTVLARIADETVLLRGFGAADRELDLLNTATTRFRVASLNKMFTATAAMSLVQEGVLSLTTLVADVLPDYFNHIFAASVTLHQLLTHTSGMGDFWGSKFDLNRAELRDAVDYVNMFAHLPPLSPPGSCWRYSSLGYIVVGRMLEVALGCTYDEVVRARVFAPAQMNDTGSLPESSDVPGRAVGYMRAPGGWAPNTDTLPFRGTPAGGGYSTVEDLDRFATALLQGRLLDSSHTEQLLSPQVEATPDMHYAYGFMVEVRRGSRTIGHTGASRGMAGVFRACPEAGWRVAVLSNRDAPAAGLVADSICEQIGAARPT